MRKVIVINGKNPTVETIVKALNENKTNIIVFTGIGATKINKLKGEVVKEYKDRFEYFVPRKLAGFNLGEALKKLNVEVVAEYGDFEKTEPRKVKPQPVFTKTKEEANEAADLFFKECPKVIEPFYNRKEIEATIKEYGGDKYYIRGCHRYAQFRYDGGHYTVRF